MHRPRLPLPQLLLLALSLLVLVPRPGHAAGEPVNGFPSWEERVLHAWTNRARADPQFEMNACPAGNCPDAACYAPIAPLASSLALNRSARFHSDQLATAACLQFDSLCTLVSNIDALYPDSCDGSASCACQEGFAVCGGFGGTDVFTRLALFGSGSGARGESISATGDPDTAFYLFLHEAGTSATCGFTVDHGNRFQILNGAYGSYGAGVTASRTATDFGPGSSVDRIPSGAHYPRQASSVDLWANWYDAAGPSEAVANVGGSCTPMTLARGSGENGAWHAAASGVGSGCHRYVFEFRAANGEILSFPTTGSFGIGAEGACADWEPTRPAPCLVPPPVPSVAPLIGYTLVPALMVAVGVLATRRRA